MMPSMNSPTAAILLDATQLQQGLATSRWHRLTVVERTGSTSTDLLAGLKAGTTGPGAVIVAAEQDGGHGRHRRPWSSPLGRSIALSAAITLPADRAWTLVPLLTGLATARAIEQLAGQPLPAPVELDATGFTDRLVTPPKSPAQASTESSSTTSPPPWVQLKWPNDVLLNQLKCAGLLVETVARGSETQAVIGIGLNISQTAAELPTPESISLALAGVVTSREAAAVAVLRQLDEVLALWEAGHDLLPAYRAYSATLGQSVRLTFSDRPDETAICGQASAIAASGELGLIVDGELRWFAAGDVHHLRVAPDSCEPGLSTSSAKLKGI
jgi:BirA family biotin operon repressor/biotin-[acetyl-CoA-carboxylase] ligase